MIQSYKQKYQLADHYDAILIGSGMGCLAAAACLTKEERRDATTTAIQKPRSARSDWRRRFKNISHYYRYVKIVE